MNLKPLSDRVVVRRVGVRTARYRRHVGTASVIDGSKRVVVRRRGIVPAARHQGKTGEVAGSGGGAVQQRHQACHRSIDPDGAAAHGDVLRQHQRATAGDVQVAEVNSLRRCRHIRRADDAAIKRSHQLHAREGIALSNTAQLGRRCNQKTSHCQPLNCRPQNIRRIVPWSTQVKRDPIRPT